MSDTYTPPEVAKLWRVKPSTVLAWIDSGELVAFNAAVRKDGRRPRYRITAEALEAFQRLRSATADAPLRQAPKPRRLPPVAREWV